MVGGVRCEVEGVADVAGILTWTRSRKVNKMNNLILTLLLEL